MTVTHSLPMMSIDKTYDAGGSAAFRRAGAQKPGADKSRPTGWNRKWTAWRAATLRKLATEIDSNKSTSRLEDLERRLTVLEEKLFAALLAATPDEEIVTVRTDADRDLAPYRRKMAAAQIEQLLKQYAHKRLLQKYGLPRLSLFYM